MKSQLSPRGQTVTCPCRLMVCFLVLFILFYLPLLFIPLPIISQQRTKLVYPLTLVSSNKTVYHSPVHLFAECLLFYVVCGFNKGDTKLLVTS